MSDIMPYTVEAHIEKIEIRHYPASVFATVRGMPDNKAFRILFRYISGNNRAASKIAMTVPVVSSGVRIPMTTPVVSSEQAFSFVLPAGSTIETSPEPADDRSALEAVPERWVAALRFRGRATPPAVEARMDELQDVLARHEVRTIGAPFLMRYNAPGTLPFLRRNEVGIEVIRR